MSSIVAEKKIVLGIEYDGSCYHGWQKQPNLVTVQGTLEKALAKVANCAEVNSQCAGRTDIGVHAFSQVVHFITVASRDLDSWVKGTNSNLPATIRVTWAREFSCASDFHARFSALSRHYRYFLYVDPVAPAILHNKLSFFPFELDVKAMHKAAQILCGEHDFSAFRAADCQSLSTKRNVMDISVFRLRKNSKIVVVDIVANAFLQHMVRNIVGTLLEVGRKRKAVKWVAEVLKNRDRKLAGATAKPYGLYFVDVKYPKKFKIPQVAVSENFL